MKHIALKTLKIFFGGMVIAILSGLMEVTVSAPIVLRFSSHLPARDPFNIAMLEGLDQIEKKAKGAVKFEKFFDGTLIGVRDSWEELLKGMADIVVISAPLSPGEKIMPHYLAINTAWIGVKDLRTQLKIQKQLLKEFPELEKEWSAVKPLSLHGIAELHFHTRKGVRSLTDFKGMQIRGLGSWPRATVEKLGASLVALPNVGELYMALQKGIVDGAILDNSALLGFRLAEVAPFTLELGGIFPGVNTRMCMNLNTWKKLPQDIQKAFEEMEEWIDERYLQLRDERTREALDFAKEKKHNFVSLPPQELAKLHELLREEAFGEAKKLDARGLPATKIFNRMQELIKETR